MPAYVALDTDEFNGGVVFAKNIRDARRIGANVYSSGEQEYIQVTRRKDLDQYEAEGVPARVLAEEGWWFECHGCGMRIDDCSMEDAGLPISGIVGKDGGAIYCCHTCRRDHLTRDAAVKAFGSAFLDMLADMVTARFGDAVIADRRHVYVPRYEPLVVMGAEVSFSFPGQKIGPATLSYRHEGKYCAKIIGPVMPEVMCCAGDKDAFEAWAKRA
jgi:hypothetical protein